MSAHIAWSAGGDGELVEHDGGVQITVRSTRPFPPGAPVGGSLGVEAGAAMGFVVKVANSRKVGDGAWDVRGRLVSATVELIAAFARALAAAS